MGPRLAPTATALAFAACLSCGGGSSPAPSPVRPTPTPPPTPQDAWVLTGAITAYGTSTPITGAHVTLENGSTTDTDSAGVYRFSSQTPRANRPFHIRVEADGFLTREVNVRYDAGTRTIDLDLIRQAAPFSLAFYRQIARDEHDTPEGPLEPLWRLEESLNVFVRTVDQNGRAIEPAVISRLSGTIRDAVRDWSHGALTVPALETGTETRPRTEGWIVVNVTRDSKSDYCGLAYVGSTEGEITFVSDLCDCGSNKIPRGLVYHEVGHALGFFHVSDRHAVMYPELVGGCSAEHLTANEQYHSQLVYSRHRGNSDPDSDSEDMLLSRTVGGRPDILIRN